MTSLFKFQKTNFKNQTNSNDKFQKFERVFDLFVH